MTTELIVKSIDTTFYLNSFLPNFPLQWNRKTGELSYNFTWKRCHWWVISLWSTLCLASFSTHGYIFIRQATVPIPFVKKYHVALQAACVFAEVFILSVAVNILIEARGQTAVVNAATKSYNELVIRKSFMR
jgi:hypothetical protein